MTKTPREFGIAGIALLTLLLAPGVRAAQGVGTSTDTGTGTSADEGGLQEIVVTAEKVKSMDVKNRLGNQRAGDCG